MITPLDIENKKFSKQMMNGYSVEEVDDFLDDLTACYEKIYKDNNENQSKIDELEASLKHYKSIEGTLNNTLIMAQSTAEDIKNVAKQQADQIVNQAKGTAQKQANELDNEIIVKKNGVVRKTVGDTDIGTKLKGEIEDLMELLNDKIQNIHGVVSTETLISLEQSMNREIPVMKK